MAAYPFLRQRKYGQLGLLLLSCLLHGISVLAMKPTTELNVTLRHIGDWGFHPPHELLQEALKNTSNPLSSPYLKRAPEGYISWSNEACLAMTNSTRSTWVMYGYQEIWNRIVVWKLPLITLLFQLPRPPFPFRWWTNTTVFQLFHLIGNPVSTIASLLVTVYGCQQRARGFRRHIAGMNAKLIGRNNQGAAGRLQKEKDVLWKRLALIQVSYDEWGVENAYEFLCMSLNWLYLEDIREKKFASVMRHFEVAADSLAGDRSTYVLPIFIAQFVFIISIGAAYWRIIGVPPGPGVWTNVEAYAIAMSAPFLYLLPAVFLGAVIGVSQTERSIPRALNDLYDKLEMEEWYISKFGAVKTGIPRVEEKTSGKIFPRIYYGGMYSWRPDLFLPDRIRATWPHILLSFLVVFLSVFVAGWISFQVPPQGFDCRNAGQASLLGVWILSFALDYLLATLMTRLGYGGRNGGWWYEITFVKEFIMGSSALVVILMTQFGIFNRCDCFTLWGKVPLALPEIPEVKAVLMNKIAFEWPAVTFGWIGIEMMVCGVLWYVYKDAFEVYNQGDGPEKKETE